MSDRLPLPAVRLHVARPRFGVIAAAAVTAMLVAAAPVFAQSGWQSPPTDTPSGLAVSDNAGGRVTLTWLAPAMGAVPQQYVVEGGLLPGQTLVALPTGHAAPVVSLSLPVGIYFARVRALTSLALSGPSNEVRIVVGAALPPSAPAYLLGMVNGSSLALSWTNTYDGGEPAAVALAVSGPVSGVVPLELAETFTFAGVPPGTYILQVVAWNTAGVSPPSNAITLTFPAACTGIPGPPTRFVATRTGATIALQWQPPETGAATTGYRLLVGTPAIRERTDARAAAGAHPPGRYVFSVAVQGRSIAGTVPPDFYTFYLSAENACGLGLPAGPLTVVVP